MATNPHHCNHATPLGAFMVVCIQRPSHGGAHDGEPKCKECDGRGWHIGECHPRETCGVCDGSGVAQVQGKE